jgi:hypothetical protein
MVDLYDVLFGILVGSIAGLIVVGMCWAVGNFMFGKDVEW